ncbi:MAG: VIT domain-containing protein, partial [Polyangia bacterium]|nr:VIT domain-containing protein [Polyangia bacterium]
MTYSRNARLRALCSIGLLSGLLALQGCKPTIKVSPPPRHSVGIVTPVRGAIDYQAPGAKGATSASTDLRVEEGARVSTAGHGRATLALDAGGFVLIDRDTVLHVSGQALTLEKGRIWVDAQGATLRVLADAGEVIGTDAAFDVRRLPKGAEVYCGSAEVTLKVGEKTLRLVSGLLALLSPEGIAPQLRKIWDDWTGGLAQAGPRASRSAAGIGVLEARTSSEVGFAHSPLLVREHRVEARILGELALTQVEQHFFNPRSDQVEGTYRVRLPEQAIIRSFAAGPKDSVREAGIASRSKGGGSASQAVLEWEAPDQYVASLGQIRPGGTAVVRLAYVQWLHRREGRRRYVYPMGGGRAPKLGEFSLQVDVKEAGAASLKAGLEAKREGDRVMVRRSDFEPRADFVLELMDPEREARQPVLYHARSGVAEEPSYAALTLVPPFRPGASAGPRPVKLVVVADVSAGAGEAELALTRRVVDAILRQLTPEDQVAVLAASVDAASVTGKEGLLPATADNKSALLGALGKVKPGGGSDLEQALLGASRLLPAGEGSVVYVGDGQPTLGTLAPGLLRDRLARRLAPPRLFAVGVGDHAAQDLLAAVTDGLGFALAVRDALEAPRAALAIVAHAARPTYRQLRVDLGPNVDRIYPRRPVTVEDGTFLHVLGRLRGEPPRHAILTGLRDGKPFKAKVAIAAQKVEDHGDLRRRWAFHRTEDLLRDGAGREAITEVGVRFGVVTPFTGLLVGAGGSGSWYESALPEDPAGTYVPEALRGGPPAAGTVIAFEPGWSTRGGSPLSLEELYRHALHAKLWTAVRASFDRKATARPDLSGTVVLTIEVNPDGSVHKVTHEAERSSLRDPDVVEDILRLAQSVRLPETPTGERVTFAHAFTFAPADISDVPSRCLNPDGTRKRSPESFRYLDVRRALWRERLYRDRSALGAHRLWNAALACGEIQLDTDGQALLVLALDILPGTRARVDLYQRLRQEAYWVRSFLRREILRRVKTLDDVEAVRAGLSLDGGLDRALLEQMLKKADKDQAKIEVVRRFLSLSPQSLTLRMMLMHLLERTGKLEEAERTAWELRSDPAADAGVRQQVGAFFLRRGNTAEARRAFSELVEFAPYDPWARRRLGHLLLAQAADAERLEDAAERAWARRLFEDAYREYETLAWLTPGDQSVLLFMANAASGIGRMDWALRLTQRVAESAEASRGDSGPAGWARLAASVRLARMRKEAAAKPELLGKIRSRALGMGVPSFAKDVALITNWTHPDAALELWVRWPGQEEPRRVGMGGAQVGLGGLRRRHAEIWGASAPKAPTEAGQKPRERGPAVDLARTPLYVEIRCGDLSPDRVTPYHGELWLLWNEG